jgi:hypothetical protein
MDRAVNEKVKRFSSSNELRFCPSENEIPASGWAIHASAKLRQTVALDSASVSWSAAEGEEFSADVCQVFVNGQFVGDAKTVELAIVDHRPYTELIWLPVPAYD